MCGLVVITLIVVFLGCGGCVLDCDFPTSSNVMTIISLNIAGDSTLPTITLTREFHLVCLAHGSLRNRYRAFSVIAEYNCVGNSACPSGTVTEQFESSCRQNSWSNLVYSSAENNRDTSPSATFSTSLRHDCVICVSPLHDSSSDSVNHCKDCNSACTALRPCFGSSVYQCCNIYTSSDSCGIRCQTGYSHSGAPNFTCSRNCPDNLNGTISNGVIEYSQSKSGNGYPVNTIATVVCGENYESNGVDSVVCTTNNGAWNTSLSDCVEIECEVPPNPLNGMIESFPPHIPVGTVLTYICDDGYMIRGGMDNSTCQSNRTWSNTNIECTKVRVYTVKTCPEVEVTSGEVFYSQNASGKSYPTGTVVTIKCIDGSVSNGYGVVCTEDGVWNASFTNCSAVEDNKRCSTECLACFITQENCKCEEAQEIPRNNESTISRNMSGVSINENYIEKALIPVNAVFAFLLLVEVVIVVILRLLLMRKTAKSSSSNRLRTTEPIYEEVALKAKNNNGMDLIKPKTNIKY